MNQSTPREQAVNNGLRQRKYRISALLNQYTASQQSIRRKQIIEVCGISKQTLSKWENMTQNDAADIPFTCAISIARLLAVRAEDLITNKK